jgi:hypothetical protein
MATDLAPSDPGEFLFYQTEDGRTRLWEARPSASARSRWPTCSSTRAVCQIRALGLVHEWALRRPVGNTDGRQGFMLVGEVT